MKFVIRIQDIEFDAKNEEEAQDVAIDILNDIAKNGDYEILEKRR